MPPLTLPVLGLPPDVLREGERLQSMLWGGPQLGGVTAPTIDYNSLFAQLSQSKVNALGLLQEESKFPALQQLLLEEKRKNPRLPIQTIHRLSQEALQEGLAEEDVYDERPAVIKFLDYIDLPRNTIANIAWGDPNTTAFFGGLAESFTLGATAGALSGGLLTAGLGSLPGALFGGLAGAGVFLGGSAIAAIYRALNDEPLLEESITGRAYGTFRQPKIFASDVLEGMGVENRVIRAVLGFIGDVMLDPLTYLSGGGNFVTWAGRNGVRMRIAGPAHKLLTSFVDSVIATRKLPEGHLLTPGLRSFFQADELGNVIDTNLITMGREMVDVAEGTNRIPRIMEALKRNRLVMTTGKMTPSQFAAKHGSLLDALRAEIGYFANTSAVGLSPQAVEKARAAHEFVNRYAARSSLAFTFPLVGFLANRMPEAFRGISGSLPIGRIGAPAEFRKSLGESFEATLARQEAHVRDQIGRLEGRITEIQGTVDAPLVWLEGNRALPEGLPNLERFVEKPLAPPPLHVPTAHPPTPLVAATALPASAVTGIRQEAQRGITAYRGINLEPSDPRYLTDPGNFGRGLYYTTDVENARDYAAGGRVETDSIRLTNPLVLDRREAGNVLLRYIEEYRPDAGAALPPDYRLRAAQSITDDALAAGYDGIIITPAGAPPLAGDVLRDLEIVDFRMWKPAPLKTRVPLRAVTPGQRDILLNHGFQLTHKSPAIAETERLKAVLVQLDRIHAAENVDLAQRALNKYGEDIELTERVIAQMEKDGDTALPPLILGLRDDIERLRQSEALAEQDLRNALNAPTRDMIDRADDYYGTAMRNDLLTTMNGPFGFLRKLFLGREDRTIELTARRLSEAHDMRDMETRPLQLTQRIIQKQLAPLDPSSRGAAAVTSLTTKLHDLEADHARLIAARRAATEFGGEAPPVVPGAPVTPPTKLGQRVTITPPPLPPRVQDSLEAPQRVAVPGAKQDVFVRFAHTVDRMLYEAKPLRQARGIVEKGRAREARQWVQRALGVRNVNRLRARLMDRIAAQIKGGRIVTLKKGGAELIARPGVQSALSRIMTRLDKGERLDAIRAGKLTPEEVDALSAVEITSGAAAGGPERAMLIMPSRASARAVVRLQPKEVERMVPGELFPRRELDKRTLRAISPPIIDPETGKQLSPGGALWKRMNAVQSQIYETADKLDHATRLTTEMDRVTTMLEAAEKVANDNIEALRKTLDEKQAATFHQRVIVAAQRGQVALRDVLRIGARGRAGSEAAQRVRRIYENVIPILQQRAVGVFKDGIKDLHKRLGEAVEYRDVADAVWLHLIARYKLKKGTRTGLLADDVLNDRLLEITNNPKYRQADGKNRIMDAPETNRMAQSMFNELERLRVDLIKQDFLPRDFDPVWAYLPMTMEDAAAEAGRRLSKELGEIVSLSSQAGRRFRVEQAFLMPRTTLRARIHLLDKNGEPTYRVGVNGVREPVIETIWRGQLRPAKTTRTTPHQIILGDKNNSIEATRQLMLEKNPSLRKSGDLFDMGLGGDPNGKRWAFDDMWHVTSPHHVNAHKEDFIAKVGLGYAGNIFVTDPALALANRVSSQAHLQAAEMFRITMAPHIRTMTRAQFAALPNGARAGTKRIGDIGEFRQLNRELVKDSTLRLPIPDVPEGVVQMWPEELAAEIENVAKVYHEPEGLNTFLKGFDNTMTVWKIMMLGHFRWLLVNVVGSSILGQLAGSNPLNWPNLLWKHGRDVMKVHGVATGGRVGDYSKKLVTIGGVSAPAHDFLIQALQDGVISSGRYWQEILPGIRMGTDTGKGLAKMTVTHHPAIRGILKWFKYNAMVEDTMRYVFWIDLRNQGFSRAEASRLIHKFLFDYGELSIHERAFGTRMWPFYRWMRNNAALQVKLALEKPAYAAAFPKIVNGLDEALSDEMSMPKTLQPRWLRDQLAVEMRRKGSEATYLALSSLTPAQELLEIGQGVMGGEGFAEFMRYGASGMNPLLKNIFELGGGHEIFTGRKIGGEEEGGVSYPEYAMRQTGALYEYLAKVPRAFRGPKGEEADVTAAVSRFLIGGRLQTQDIERLIRTKRFDAGETATQLRFEIRRAVEDGDEARARELSLRYVAMHRQLWEIGMHDLVPGVLKRLFRTQDFNRKAEKLLNRGDEA